MALIKCSKCGHLISDKAVRCPKCGTSTKEKEENVFAETKDSKSETPIIEVATSVEETVNQSKKSRNNLLIPFFVIVAIVIASLLYMGANILFEQVNNAPNDNTAYDVRNADTTLTELSTMSENAFANEHMDSYISISAILEIENSGSRSVATEKLQEYGYEKIATEDNTDNWVKNTTIAKEEVGYGGGASEIEYAAQDRSKGSFVRVVYDSSEKITWMDVEIYEKSTLEQWKKEFLKLGYTITYDNTPYDEIGQNYHDTEETCECQKEGWIIGGGRDGGCWVDMMLFNKGNKEYTDKDGTAVKPNQYAIYNHGEGSGYVLHPFDHAAYDY